MKHKAKDECRWHVNHIKYHGSGPIDYDLIPIGSGKFDPSECNHRICREKYDMSRYDEYACVVESGIRCEVERMAEEYMRKHCMNNEVFCVWYYLNDVQKRTSTLKIHIPYTIHEWE